MNFDTKIMQILPRRTNIRVFKVRGKPIIQVMHVQLGEPDFILKPKDN
jgi:hypothetical protein